MFGVSMLSIKLPSILLGFGSALGLLYLLNLWYKKNVAIIVAIIAVTTNQFLLASQAGQAGIMYIFLTIVTLISASMIARRSTYAKLWAVVGFMFAAVSLYMPLNIYMLLALILTALIHPHARHLVFKKSSRLVIALGSILAALIISPLAVSIVNNPQILQRLLGIPDSFEGALGSAGQLLRNYTQFAVPTAGDVITPVYGLGLVVLILVGIYRLFTAKYTARSYVISFWLVALVPFVCLNPEFISITFVPVILLVALGVDYLITSWYKLFPHNPYARVFGLAPLGILMIGLVLSSVDRYAYGLHYDKGVYSSYSYDLPLLQKKLSKVDESASVALLVTKENEAFYSVYAKHQQRLKSLTVSSDEKNIPSADIIIAERAFAPAFSNSPAEILVTRTSDNADRFYVYKNQ